MAIYLSCETDKNDRIHKNFPQQDVINIGGDDSDWDLKEHSFKAAFSIRKDRLAYRLYVTQSPVSYLGQVHNSGDFALKSGANFECGDKHFHFMLVHDEIKVAQRNGLLSNLSQFLLMAILAGELILAIFLPKIITSGAMMDRNTAIEKSVTLLDKLRRKAADNSTLYKEASPTVKSLLLNIKKDLDRKAWYLRKESETTSLSEVKDLYNELKTFNKIFNQLEQGNLFEKAQPVDASKILQAALNEEEQH